MEWGGQGYFDVIEVVVEPRGGMAVVAACVRYALVQKTSDKIVLQDFLVLIRARRDMRGPRPTL